MKETDADPLLCFREKNVDTTLRIAKESINVGGKCLIFICLINVFFPPAVDGDDYLTEMLVNHMYLVVY